MHFRKLFLRSGEHKGPNYIEFYSRFAEYIYATLPRTQRGQPIVLGGDPKGKNFLYTNGNSVIIRNIDVSVHPADKVLKCYGDTGRHLIQDVYLYIAQLRA